MSGSIAGKSFAIAIKVSTTNASFKTDLIWPNETDRLKKTSDIEKPRKLATNAIQKQQTSVASQVSLDYLNSQEACTSGQPCQSKPALKETMT